MRRFAAILAFATVLGNATGAPSAPIARRVIVDVAEDESTFTELRARVEQTTGDEEIKLVITASGGDATALRLDRASFITDSGPESRELQHDHERLYGCPDPGRPEHALVAFDISAALLQQFVEEGAPWQLRLEESGRTVKTLLIPVSAIAEFLADVSSAHQR